MQTHYGGNFDRGGPSGTRTRDLSYYEYGALTNWANGPYRLVGFLLRLSNRLLGSKGPFRKPPCIPDSFAVFSKHFHSLWGKPIISHISWELPNNWSWQRDLNSQPPEYEAGALPVKLCQRAFVCLPAHEGRKERNKEREHKDASLISSREVNQTATWDTRKPLTPDFVKQLALTIDWWALHKNMSIESWILILEHEY